MEPLRACGPCAVRASCHVNFNFTLALCTQVAATWYANTDRLVHWLNQDGRVNAFYSTPAEVRAELTCDCVVWLRRATALMAWRALLPLSSRHRLCVNNRHSAPFTTFLCSFHAQRLLARRVAVRRRQALPRLVLAQQVRPLPVRGCVRAVVKLDSGRVFPRCAPLNAPAPHLPPRKCVPPPPELAPADSPHSVWSGYFVSRSALKGYIRFASSVFQAAKQVQLLTGGAPDVSPANPLYRLERSMGERQGERRVARAANERR